MSVNAATVVTAPPAASAREVPERRADRALVGSTDDVDVDLLARPMLPQSAEKVLDGVDLDVANSGDHVAGLDSGVAGRAVRDDVDDECAGVATEVELLGDLRRELGGLDAEIRVQHLAGGQELLDDVLDGRRRDGEADRHGARLGRDVGDV